jgi:hypothetical protein
MGTWDTGPFDNDSAADFAGAIQDCTGPEARHDLLLATLGAGTEALPRAELTNEYSWGYELEQAFAAAAFVADEYTGRKQFTDTSYARGVDDDMELNPFAEIRMSEELLKAARLFTGRMISKMGECGIDRELVEPVVEVGFALSGTGRS